MAQKVLVRLLDDVDGGEAAETVRFSVDDVHYVIDLSVGNAEALRAAFAPWVGAARRQGAARPTVTRRRRAGGGGADAGDPAVPGGGGARNRAPAATVRAWAREHGYPTLADRGRIPEGVRAAYETAMEGQ